MPGFWSLRLCLAVFGLLFFAFQVVMALLGGVRSASDRDRRIEAAGSIVPGLAGLFIAAACFSPWRALLLVMAVASVVFLVFGRAGYELIVFRPRRRS